LKSIYTLRDDIYSILNTEGWYNDKLAKQLDEEIQRRLVPVLGVSERTPSIRLSGLRETCPKAYWYSIHRPDLREPLPPWARFKYTYGHIIEALAVILARAAGHTVEGEQDVLEVDGIKGHRDAVVDGCIVDFKSCSSRQMEKFTRKTIQQTDDFGYLLQLDGYISGSQRDPLVLVKDKAFIFAIDKTLGHMELYEHEYRPSKAEQRICSLKGIVGQSVPPDCTCELRPIGASGNTGLGTIAGYSSFKHCCFPNLRTFLYASGPVYLTHVERKPDVPEIDKYGKYVYH
jgi:hypothetical protein